MLEKAKGGEDGEDRRWGEELALGTVDIPIGMGGVGE